MSDQPAKLVMTPAIRAALHRLREDGSLPRWGSGVEERTWTAMKRRQLVEHFTTAPPAGSAYRREAFRLTGRGQVAADCSAMWDGE